MFTRALIALPGMVAFIIPATWLWQTGHTQLAQPFGLLSLAFGALGLLWCVRDFYVSGKGTLAPWAPPKTLVVVGLYRYSRNPMYVSVALVLVGWAISFGSKGLLIYALVVVAAFHLRVVLGEEPWLARTHGEQWRQYATRVPRWFW
jgi:protein-S-isoprenylcysteine O-methyltransferase Ste14